MMQSQIVANLWLLASTVLGAIVGGAVTYFVQSRLKKKESGTQIQAARMALCVALRADAELCHRLADDFTRSLPQIRIPTYIQTHILTGRDLLLPVIKSHTIAVTNDLSDMDIQKLVAALRALTAVIALAETKSEAAFQLPEELRSAQGACCVALEALGQKTQGFRMSDIPDYVCPLTLRSGGGN